MGRFRKFLPLHRVRRWWSRGWRSRACRRSSGFFSKDEIISQRVPRPRLRALDRRARRRGASPRCYMTRLILLTFYGNERFATRRLSTVAVVSRRFG